MGNVRRLTYFVSAYAEFYWFILCLMAIVLCAERLLTVFDDTSMQYIVLYSTLFLFLLYLIIVMVSPVSKKNYLASIRKAKALQKKSRLESGLNDYLSNELNSLIGITRSSKDAKDLNEWLESFEKWKAVRKELRETEKLLSNLPARISELKLEEARLEAVTKNK